MYARLTVFNMGPGKREIATALADDAVKRSRDMEGFVSATYMIFDEEAGDYGSLTLWQTKANADAAASSLMTWMKDEIGDKLTAPPLVRLAEVYEPS